MTVLTKTKKRYPVPKCQEPAKSTGKPCKFNGSRYVDGKFVCWRHSGSNK